MMRDPMARVMQCIAIASFCLLVAGSQGGAEARELSAKNHGKLTTARPAAVLARKPHLMGATFGFAPPPIYAMTIKGFSNFTVGLLLLVGAGPMLAWCFPGRCAPSPRNASTGELITTEMSNDVFLPLSEDGTQEVRPALEPGHRVTMENGERGVVVQVAPSFPDARCPPVLIVLDNGERLKFQDKENLHNGGESILELKRCEFTPTFTSNFLNKYQIKPLAVAFQFAGIVSSAYAFVMLSQASPVKSWADWEILALLISQHPGAVTIIGVQSQTSVIAASARDRITRYIASSLFVGSCVVALPLFASLLSVGATGIGAYVLPGLILGIVPFMLIMLALQTLNSKMFIGTGVEARQRLGGKSPDEVRDECDAKTRVGKAWALTVEILPANAQYNGFSFFLGVAYSLTLWMGVPLWWLLLCGFVPALPVALAFWFEVFLPLVGLLIFTALTFAMSRGLNLIRSGVLMVLAFAMSHAATCVFAEIVPASILARDPTVGVFEALPMAFASRQGKPYLKHALLPVKEFLGQMDAQLPDEGSECTSEGLSNITCSNRADLAIRELEHATLSLTQLISLLT